MNHIEMVGFLVGFSVLTVTSYLIEPPIHSVATEVARIFSIYIIGLSLGMTISD